MTERSDNSGRSGETRRPDPNAAQQDPENAALQQQVAADHDALREQARRTEATTPPDVRTRARES